MATSGVLCRSSTMDLSGVAVEVWAVVATASLALLALAVWGAVQLCYRGTKEVTISIRAEGYSLGDDVGWVACKLRGKDADDDGAAGDEPVVSAPKRIACFVGDALEVRVCAPRNVSSEFIELARLVDESGGGVGGAAGGAAAGGDTVVSGAALNVSSFSATFEKDENGKNKDELSCVLGPFTQKGQYVVNYLSRRDDAKADWPTQRRDVLLSSAVVRVQEPELRLSSPDVFYRESIKVSFTASPVHHEGDLIRLCSRGGDTTRLAADRSVEKNVKRDALPGNLVVFDGDAFAPPTPGQYELLYISGNDGSVFSSASLTVKEPEIAVVEPPLGIFWNDPVICSFRTSTEHHKKDYVVLSETSDEFGEDGKLPERTRQREPREPFRRNYVYVPRDDNTGELVFGGGMSPSKTGVYAFFYFNEVDRILARSPPFVVNGPVVELDGDGNFFGESVSVRLRASAKRSTSDQLVLKRTDSANDADNVSRYVPRPPPDAVSGEEFTVTFEGSQAPPVPGTYRAEYLPAGWHPDSRSVSDEIEIVGPSVSVIGEVGYWATAVGVRVETSSADRKGDIISLARYHGDPLVKYSLFGNPTSHFLEVPQKRDATLYFEGDLAPPSPGDWQFAYIVTSKGNREVARSPRFTVIAPTVQLALLRSEEGRQNELVSESGSKISPPRCRVEYASSKSHSTRDWIGLSRLGAEPNVEATRGLYHWVPAASTGTIVFENKYMPRSEGQYEACYVHGDTGEVLCRSNPFSIDFTTDGTAFAELLHKPAPKPKSRSPSPEPPPRSPPTGGVRRTTIRRSTSTSSSRSDGARGGAGGASEGTSVRSPRGHPMGLGRAVPVTSPEPARQPSDNSPPESDSGAQGDDGGGGDDRFAKYRKSLKILPEPVVRRNMKLAGLSDADIAEFFGEPAPPSAPTTATGGGGGANAPSGGGGAGFLAEIRSKPKLRPTTTKQRPSLAGGGGGAAAGPAGGGGGGLSLVDQIKASGGKPSANRRSGPPRAGEVKAAASEASGPTLSADPRFDKYRRSSKILPEAAVRRNMTMDGLSEADIAEFFGTAAPGGSSAGAGAAPAPAGGASLLDQIKAKPKLRTVGPEPKQPASGSPANMFGTASFMADQIRRRRTALHREPSEDDSEEEAFSD